MKSLSNKPSGCSRLIIPVTALGILSSLLMPEVRDEVSHFLSPVSNPGNPNPRDQLDVFLEALNRDLEQDGMTLLPAAIYMKYKSAQDYLTSKFAGISTKMNAASKTWYIETDFKEILTQIIQIVESDPMLKEYIEQGLLKPSVIMKLDSGGKIIIQIRFIVPFQKEEPLEINIELKNKPILV